MNLVRLAIAAALVLSVLSSATIGQAIQEKTQVPRTDPARKAGTLPISDEDKADRARRALDAQAERLEREARKVMSTICRGC